MIIKIDTIGEAGMVMHLVSPAMDDHSPRGHWLWRPYSGWKPPRFMFLGAKIEATEIQ